MIISERIIKVLKERNMTQAEFAKQVGISTSTISEWKKRKTNPTVEKIMDICNQSELVEEDDSETFQTKRQLTTLLYSV